MAHGTYGHKRSGSTASALRMQEMVDKVNGGEKRREKKVTKDNKSFSSKTTSSSPVFLATIWDVSLSI